MFNLRKSISTLLCKSFQTSFLKYSFTMYPSKADRKLFAPAKYPNLEDDLFFPHENEKITGGFQIMVDNLKKRSETRISGRGACLVMYNCGVKNFYEPEIFKMCERDIAINRNNLEPRLIFGGLYGALKTNAASPFLLEFFIEEFQNIINKKDEGEVNEEGKPMGSSPKFSFREFFELIEACSYNRTLKKEKLFKFMKEFIKPAILAHGKDITYKNSVGMIKNLEAMEFYDEEMWRVALKKLEAKIRFTNLLLIQDFYDVILKSKNSGKNPIDLTKIIKKLQDKLRSRVDFRWRYNVEENRFYTFEELKAKREEYNFPDQSMNVKSRYHRERLARYNQEADVSTELVAKKRKLTLEKELEQLSFERFMKQKGLESKGALDETKQFQEEIEEEAELSLTRRPIDPKVAKRHAKNRMEADILLRADRGENFDLEEFEKLKEKKGKKQEETKEEEEKDEGDLDEEEKKARKAEKDVGRQKFLLEQKKKEKAKLGKGKNKEAMKRIREGDVEPEKPENEDD